MIKPKLKVKKPEQLIKQDQRQAKLAAIADKKAKGKLTLEDLDAKLDVVIEMLADLIRR